jgi:hypothetical protein
MNATAGRGDEGITREILQETWWERAAMLNLGDVVETEAGDMAGSKHVHMRLVGLGDKQVLVVERQARQAGQAGQARQDGQVAEQQGEESGEVERLMRSMRGMRSFIDRLDPPMDEARSRAAFARVMRKLREQQDTELRWRWVRRVATALAAAAGAGAVRMLSR